MTAEQEKSWTGWVVISNSFHTQRGKVMAVAENFLRDKGLEMRISCDVNESEESFKERVAEACEKSGRTVEFFTRPELDGVEVRISTS